MIHIFRPSREVGRSLSRVKRTERAAEIAIRNLGFKNPSITDS